MVRIALLLSTVAAVLMADVRRASACSAPGPSLYSRSVVPGDGATGVPTNARVRVLYLGHWNGVLPPALSLREAAGASVEVSFEWRARSLFDWLVVVTPSLPLQPSTTYEVLDELSLPCEDPSGDCLGEPIVVATFTTGTGADMTPPVFGGGATVESALGGCADSACCGPYDSVNFEAMFTVATGEPVGGVLYEVILQGEEQPIARVPGVAFHGMRVCDGLVMFDGVTAVTLHGDAPFALRAYDVAGNFADSDWVTDVNCPAVWPEPDAGPAAAVDAGPGQDAGLAAVNDGGGGCGCNAGRRDRGQPLGWLLIAALVLIASSRASRSASRVNGLISVTRRNTPGGSAVCTR